MGVPPPGLSRCGSGVVGVPPPGLSRCGTGVMVLPPPGLSRCGTGVMGVPPPCCSRGGCVTVVVTPVWLLPGCTAGVYVILGVATIATGAADWIGLVGTGTMA